MSDQVFVNEVRALMFVSETKDFSPNAESIAEIVFDAKGKIETHRAGKSGVEDHLRLKLRADMIIADSRKILVEISIDIGGNIAFGWPGKVILDPDIETELGITLVGRRARGHMGFIVITVLIPPNI